MKTIVLVLALAFTFATGMAVNHTMAQPSGCASFAKANHCHATWSRQSFSCVCVGK
jgi:hypothetical protein